MLSVGIVATPVTARSLTLRYVPKPLLKNRLSVLSVFLNSPTVEYSTGIVPTPVTFNSGVSVCDDTSKLVDVVIPTTLRFWLIVVSLLTCKSPKKVPAVYVRLVR